MTPTLEAICGNRSAAQALLYLEAYGAGYGKGIADTYEVAVSGIQRQLQRLEANGVLVSRIVLGTFMALASLWCAVDAALGTAKKANLHNALAGEFIGLEAACGR